MTKLKILDGAMGTQLQKMGLFESPASLNKDQVDKVGSIHRAYIEAGSDIIYANTFGCHGRAIEKQEDLRLLIHNALKEAKKQARGKAQVALDLGPLGDLLEPLGTLSFDQAYKLFASNVKYALEVGFDLVVLETFSSLLELRAAILAVKDHYSGPLLVSMTFEEDGRSFSGVSPKAFGVMAQAMGVTALGINCSLGPLEMKPILEELAQVTSLPLLVKANAGLPDEEGKYNLSDQDFIQGVAGLLDLGVQYLGGCCGTSPETIARLKEAFKDYEVKERAPLKKTYLASSSKVLDLDEPCFVGEVINPTGRERLKASILKKDMEEVLRLAVAQEEAGAHLLDINVSIPGTDEGKNLERAVLGVQSLVDCPLQVDSSNPKALEQALRVTAGRPIINSVSAKEDSMREVFPLAKKYGALVIGLCLDEGGIPKTAQDRFNLGKKLVEEGKKYGLKKEEIILDPLILTLASNKDSGSIALETLALFQAEGYLTTMGTSNISFGLPYRSVLTSSFLLLALDRGCKLPIVNPLDPRIQEAIRTYRLIKGQDDKATAYLDFMEKRAPKDQEGPRLHEGFSVYQAMRRSQGADLVAYVKKALQDREAMAVIEEDLIPALDQIGQDYEDKKIYLPQLIGAASTAQDAFSYLRDSLKGQGQEKKKEKILLATVKGDIHDIGKNIAKVLLENYGYEVYDLGRDVDKEDILATIKEEDIKLLGLSALMTTTVASMEETIQYVKEEAKDVQIMVGGAVLTHAYAQQIGADFYCKDAKEDIEIAKTLFKKSKGD